MTDSVVRARERLDQAAFGRGLADYLSDTTAAPLPASMTILLSQLEPERSAGAAKGGQKARRAAALQRSA